MKFIAVLLFFATSILGCVSAQKSTSELNQVIYQKLLSDSLHFYNKELRHEPSGQYLDAISLNEKDDAEFNTSVAATGMGLVSLALGDALGEVPDAREQVLKTMNYAMGRAPDGKYISLRSRSGWFRHWFDARTGDNNKASEMDGFSTIDTAIFAAGSQLCANYFEKVGKDPDGAIRKLADEILTSIDWSTSIADAENGKIYLNFDLLTETPQGRTSVFNEYVIVSAMGALAEEKKEKLGVMTTFWDQFYRSPERLPTRSFQGISLLTDHPDHFLSNFTIQFPMYLLSDVASNPGYLNFATQAASADRLWFSQQTNNRHLWGLGAGEVRFRDPASNEIKKKYRADKIDNNPYQISSPHIIAGFIPLDPNALNDILELYKQKTCLFKYKTYEFLWRCSIQTPDIPMERLQAIDFSTMFLGLAAASPNIRGLEFFREYAPALQPVSSPLYSN